MDGAKGIWELLRQAVLERSRSQGEVSSLSNPNILHAAISFAVCQSFSFRNERLKI
jgi:hypothetical protein